MKLLFSCVAAEAAPHAAVPTLTFRLSVAEASGGHVDAVALRCQIRIEPHRRQYSAAEARRLHDLFGDPDRWAETLKPVQLATVSVMVPAFTAATEVDLDVPCTYDLEVASARYLQGLDDGTVPLLMLFSGTVFTTVSGRLSVELIPWSSETSYRMPASVWRDVTDRHFPDSAWLRCGRSTLDALSEYKSSRALPTWDATLAALLKEAEARDDPR